MAPVTMALRPNMVIIRVLICALFLLNGCREHTKPSSSVDATALQAIVTLPIPMKSVKWEIFYSPENPGGFLPTNIDSTQLIAEIEPSDPK
jgi:hypothetical protein